MFTRNSCALIPVLVLFLAAFQTGYSIEDSALPATCISVQNQEGNLTDNRVENILIDSKGRVWISTFWGLTYSDDNRWQKHQFEVYSKLTAKIIGEYGRWRGPDCICEGPPGTLWFGGSFGLYGYSEGKFEKKTSPGWLRNPSWLAAGPSGELYANAVTNQILKWKDGKWYPILVPVGFQPKTWKPMGLNSIIMRDDGGLWIGGKFYPAQDEGIRWNLKGEAWTRSSTSGNAPWAALYKFSDGKWTAFRSERDVPFKHAVPRYSNKEFLWVDSESGEYFYDGTSWHPLFTGPYPWTKNDTEVKKTTPANEGLSAIKDKVDELTKRVKEKGEDSLSAEEKEWITNQLREYLDPKPEPTNAIEYMKYWSRLSDSRFIVVTQNAMYVFHEGKYRKLTPKNLPENFSPEYITCMVGLLDGKRIWIGTSNVGAIEMELGK